MKKITKRILCMVLSTVLLLSATSLASYAATQKTVYFWDLVEFGSYPQSQVKDATLISELDKITKNWISYGYYSGNGEYGSMVQGDWMKYADFKYDGNKYRAVTFSQYRPYATKIASSEENSQQYDNGYYINNIYYFLYEPLKWRAAYAKNGGVSFICESVIDSQAYNNEVYNVIDSTNRTGRYNRLRGDLDFSDYQNFLVGDYKNSSIYEWLNNDFVNTAFSKYEKSKILAVDLPSTFIYSKMYDICLHCDSGDWDYQMAYENMVNKMRYSYASDYARAQGVRIDKTREYEEVYWWTDGSDYGYNPLTCCEYTRCFSSTKNPFSADLNYYPHLYDDISAWVTITGVRPMVCISGYGMSGGGASSVRVVNNPYVGEDVDLIIMLDGSPTKISFVDSKFNTITLDRNNKAVKSITKYADTVEIWQVTLKVNKLRAEYKLFAKYERLGWSEYYETVYINAHEREENKTVYSYSIDECYDDVMYAGVHKVTVETGVDATKVQFYKDGNTWTYSADNASYVIEDDKKIWSINMNFSELGEDMEYYIRTRSQKSAFEFTDQVMNVWVRFK